MQKLAEHLSPISVFRVLTRLPRSVWALGLVSLFMDISSEMIHALLPVFLAGTLGASAALIGLIEGISEATTSIAKLFSGVLSDWFDQRKPLILLGYALAALTKPAFPLASSPLAVLMARFADRVGKGVRGAPRDALIADATPSALRGAAYGLRQALDTTGAVLGPLLAILLMFAFNNPRTVFWWAVLPAILAVLVLALGVVEPVRAARGQRAAFRWFALRQLSLSFWLVMGAAVVFSLARFSEAFLILKGANSGLGLALAPLILITMNVVYAVTAAPAGVLSDRLGRWGLLQLGLVTLIVADVVMALATTPVLSLLGAAIFGLHLGLTQGVLSSLVADESPDALRGSAFGLFNFLSGLALFAASVAAGLLWQYQNPETMFTVAAVAALIALALAALVAHHQSELSDKSRS